MLELSKCIVIYDNDKVKQPKLDGKDETFDKVDSVVLEALTKAQAANKKIVVLSHSYPSPTFKKLFGDLKLNILMLN
jgi:molybdopterin-containing oxidoreductase family iron-sulfur binding subunit